MSLESWTEKKIISTILLLHSKFLENNDNSSDFSYTYVNNKNSKLASTISRRKIRWSDLMIKSGLDPRCHTRAVNYGKTQKEKERVFKVLLKDFVSQHGTKNLNDNKINSDISIDIPKSIFLDYKPSKICKKSKCEIFQVTGRSLYAKGRRLFGSWEEAVENFGIDYKQEVLRKVPQYSLLEVIENFDEWDKKKKGKWIVTDISKENNSLFTSILNSFTNKNRVFPFSTRSEDKVFVAWMTLEYFRQSNKIIDDSSWWKKNYQRLSERYEKNHRAQERWITQAGIGKNDTWTDNQKIIEGIHEIFSEGIRLTRHSIQKNKTTKFKTIWSAMRQKRFRDAGKFENEWLRDAGFIPERLSKIYYELDKPYSTEEVMQMFYNLMKESIDNNENRLTREYCSVNHADFTNFILAQHKSWEGGLRFYGLDPKFFNISTSKRSKRGFQFQEFVKEMFKRYGLEEKKKNPKSNEFIYNKSISGCRHKVKCKPDFYFRNLIIDTKTGYHASQKPDQLSRYHSHSGRVIVLVLKGRSRVETINKKSIEVINFKDFIKDSKKILNIQLEFSEEQELTKTLKRNPFWKN